MALLPLKEWQPFRIDALGLVTLLGGTDLDMAVGKLSPSRICEFLPLLAPFIIANKNITKDIPGATLYNVTDGILTVDVSGWFVRWLMSQKLGWNSTTLVISFNSKKRTRYLASIFTTLIGLSAIAPMIAISALQLDWFEFANAIALLLSVVVRCIVLSQNRNAVDANVVLGLDPKASFGKGHEVVKHFAPFQAAIPETLRSSAGHLLIATAVHIITIGMASLADQMICVAILVVTTVMVVKGVGCNESEIGTRLSFHLSDASDDNRRSAYSRLKPSPSEEEALCSWHFFPQRSDTEWWERYRKMLDYEETTAQ